MLLELACQGGIDLGGVNFRRVGGSEILEVCDRPAMCMDCLLIAKDLLSLV